MIDELKQWEFDKGYAKGREDALSIDMDKPMHFTDEQKAWIKNYIIINAKRQRADAIDEFKNYLLKHKKLVREFETDYVYEAVKIEFIKDTDAEQLKSQN